MTLPAAVRTRVAIGMGIGAGYFLLAHLASTVAGYEWLGVVVGVGTLYAFALMFVWSTPLRLPMIALGAAAALLATSFWDQLERQFTWFFLLEHAGTNTLLAALFGATLTRTRVPMCTRLAHTVHGDDLPAVVDRYTRRITVAWMIFFALSAIVSIGLYWGAPIEVWSAYANLLTAPLVATMFLVEYAVRVRVLPASYHSSIAQTVAAVWLRQYGGGSRPASSH